MRIRSHLALSAGCGVLAAVTSAGAATILPLGPITFDTAAVYDSNFKVGPAAGSANLNWTSDGAGGGFIRATGNSYTAFDQTAVNPATVGNGGQIGTGAGFTDGADDSNPDFNNDLSNFKISAKVRGSTLGTNAQLGFIIYMRDAEVISPGTDPNNDAIIGIVRLATATSARFLVNGPTATLAGASLTPTAGQLLFDTNNVTATGGLAANTFYTFSVEAVGDDLTLELRRLDNSLIASTSFTIPAASLKRTTGQVGMRIGGSATLSTDVDDFSIIAVPEPASIGLVSLAGLMLLRRRRARSA
ncbi:MAG: PEP-CTERM sorting domain-containing protein [Tepidisphaeraceae bacterium]